MRTFLRMVIDLGAPRPPVPAPPGIAIVSLRRGFDERAFYDTMKASFLLDFRVGEFHPYDEVGAANGLVGLRPLAVVACVGS
ncbi:hypothetical protein BH18ACT16_BH18ACT16_09730 [soil metagenome]